jgi:hypothetical protein
MKVMRSLGARIRRLLGLDKKQSEKPFAIGSP